LNARRLIVRLVALAALAAAAGCIADSAEDSDLPWASNQNWEGLMPMTQGLSGQYD